MGPIETLFRDGVLAFDDPQRRVEITSDGRDSRTCTLLGARAVMRLQEADATTTGAMVTIDYTIRGPLALFAHGGSAEAFAAEMATIFAAKLEARLTAGTTTKQQRLSAGSLVWRMLWRRLRACRVALHHHNP